MQDGKVCNPWAKNDGVEVNQAIKRLLSSGVPEDSISIGINNFMITVKDRTGTVLVVDLVKDVIRYGEHQEKDFSDLTTTDIYRILVDNWRL